MKEINRDYKIDIMKVIGLLCIILAHVGVNDRILQLRNFDVPMMVYISGYLSYNSFKQSETYIKYIFKRIRRLLLPTWIFLTIYFLILLFIRYKFNIAFPYTMYQIKRSYLLLDGIGYVWVVRVYLLCAIITPLLIKITKKISCRNVYLLIILLFIINENLISNDIYNINFFNQYILPYVLSYGIITTLGIIANNQNQDDFNILYIIFLIIFLLYCIYFRKVEGHFVYTQTRKYPPSLYYFSYSMLVTYFLMYLNLDFKNDNLLKRIVIFISKSSFWIYLWHIFAIYIVNLKFSSYAYYYKYLLIVFIAIFITAIQNLIIINLEKLNNVRLNKILKVFKG